MKSRPFTPMNMIASAAFCATMLGGGASEAQTGPKNDGLNKHDREKGRVTLTIPTVSRHSDREAYYNEEHPGFFLEYGLGKNYGVQNKQIKAAAIVGWYKNSLDTDTWAAGIKFSYDITRHLNVGLSVGVVTYPNANYNEKYSCKMYYMGERPPNLESVSDDYLIKIDHPDQLPKPYSKNGKSGHYFPSVVNDPTDPRYAQYLNDFTSGKSVFSFDEFDNRVSAEGKSKARVTPLPEINLTGLNIGSVEFGVGVKGGWVPESGWVGLLCLNANFGNGKNKKDKSFDSRTIAAAEMRNNATMTRLEAQKNTASIMYNPAFKRAY